MLFCVYLVLPVHSSSVLLTLLFMLFMLLLVTLLLLGCHVIAGYVGVGGAYDVVDYCVACIGVGVAACDVGADAHVVVGNGDDGICCIRCVGTVSIDIGRVVGCVGVIVYVVDDVITVVFFVCRCC